MHVRPHVTSLTALRGLAVALVVAAHAHIAHLAVGGYGVDVFFVLSGYLITGVLLGLAPFDRRRWGAFLRRRAYRLLPALAVTLVALAGWAAVSGQKGQGTCLALAATHTMDLPVGGASSCPGPFHITWSLAAEEQFYLLWPLLVVVLSRVPARVAAALCTTGYAAAWTAAWAVAHSSPDTAQWWNYAPFGRPTALLLGSALAFLLPLRAGVRRPPRVLAGAALPLLALGLVLTAYQLARPDGPREVVLGPLVAVPAALLVAALVRSPGHLLERARPLVLLGELSYCLYLVHVLALHLARQLSGSDAPAVNAAGTAVALAGAWALHRWVEEPVRRWGYARIGGREAVREAEREPAAAPTLVG